MHAGGPAFHACLSAEEYGHVGKEPYPVHFPPVSLFGLFVLTTPQKGKATSCRR